MSTDVKQLGIFGGTFDPIHHGHLALATNVLDHTPIDTLLLMPCYQPVHKKAPQASAKDRCAMIQLAIKDKPRLKLECCEIDRAEPSYMIDSLPALAKKYPNATLTLILGMDSFNQINHWKNWQQLSDMCHIMVVQRPGHTLTTDKKLLAWIEQKRCDNLALMQHTSHGHLTFHTMPPVDISATWIRHCLHNNEDSSFLLPKSIFDYIHDHHLYYPNIKDNKESQ
jgi:nicotinate-nucleotide adenylyltransferase